VHFVVLGFGLLACKLKSIVDDYTNVKSVPKRKKPSPVKLGCQIKKITKYGFLFIWLTWMYSCFQRHLCCQYVGITYCFSLVILNFLICQFTLTQQIDKFKLFVILSFLTNQRKHRLWKVCKGLILGARRKGGNKLLLRT
jgi:hypothetical protein